MIENLDPNMSYAEFVEVAQAAADTLLPEVPAVKKKVASWFQQNKNVMERLLLAKRLAYDRYLLDRDDKVAEVEYKKASNAVRDATRNYQTVFCDKVGDEITEAYRRGPGFF